MIILHHSGFISWNEWDDGENKSRWLLSNIPLSKAVTWESSIAPTEVPHRAQNALDEAADERNSDGAPLRQSIQHLRNQIQSILRCDSQYVSGTYRRNRNEGKKDLSLWIWWIHINIHLTISYPSSLCKMFRETKIASTTHHSGTSNQSVSPLSAKCWRSGIEFQVL